MDLALRLASIFFSMILVNNYVLVKFYGICPFLGVSKKLDSAFGMSVAVIFVMVMATAVTFPIYSYLLAPNDLTYLSTVTFILIIATLVQLVETVLKRFVPSLYNALGVYLPLITTNCAILGVTLLNIDNYFADVAELGFGTAYAEALICALGAGAGFLLAMVLFAGVRRRLEEAHPPKAFEGLPITLVAASLTSLSFMGFSGIVEGIFGA